MWGALPGGLGPKTMLCRARPERVKRPHNAPIAPLLSPEQRIVEALLSFWALALNHLQARCTVVAQAGSIQAVESLAVRSGIVESDERRSERRRRG